jgi:hypothetical protein
LPERFTVEDLGRKIAELLHLRPGQDEVEVQVDKTNRDRVMIIKHSQERGG